MIAPITTTANTTAEIHARVFPRVIYYPLLLVRPTARSMRYTAFAGYSPPCKGGVDATSTKVAKPPNWSGRGGRSRTMSQRCVHSENRLVSDHPVYAASVASRLFLS